MYRYRVKDKHSSQLNRMAKSVNLVWNYCNDVQKHALKWNQKWPTHFDLTLKTTGITKLLEINSQSIGQTCKQFVQSRKATKKSYLRYRGKNNLGWVPMKKNIRFIGNEFRYNGNLYSVWNTRPIPTNAKILDGSSFSQDARGRWYLNLAIELPAIETKNTNKSVGIDLGLKDIAVLSTGEKIAAPRFYRVTQEKLAKAQRAGKKRQAASINAKIANQRKDFLHKFTTDIVIRFDHVVVGNVSAKGLARTTMAKSVHDVAWSILRNQLAYKCDYAGARYEEVNEAYSSRTCCECGSIAGPKGREGLAVREWVCRGCDSILDRDINAARNILRSGHGTREVGAA